MRWLMTFGRGLALMALFAACSGGSFRSPGGSAETRGRRVVQTLPDPSGEWMAVIDEVEYANGLLTSVADRVHVVESASKDSEGTLVFSADASPAGEKPSVTWASGCLLIAVSPRATVLHREARAHGFAVEIHPR